MNPLFLDIALLFFIEIVEANLQRGRTFSDLVNRLYILRRSSPVRFLLLHTSLFYVLFYALIHENYSGWFFAVLCFKTVDLGLKLRLFARMERKGEAFSAERFFNAPDIPVSSALRYAGAFFYTVLFAAGLLSD